MGTFRTIKKIVSSTTKYVDDLNKTVHGTDYLEQGHDFERHVISLFNKQYFTLVHWTSDVSRKHEGIQAESDKAPDLRMRYNPTREEFYVECKFRSGLTPEGKLKWVSSDYSLNKYQRYAETPFLCCSGTRW